MNKTVITITGLLLFTTGILFGGENHKFHSLTNDDGLSSSLVTDIVKDNYGFMWFATTDGLNRYDGHSFMTFRSQPRNPNSLPTSNIKSLFFDDKEGLLWIGTQDSGLCIMDPKTGIFKRLFCDKQNHQRATAILSIISDDSSNIWAASWSKGLICYSSKTKKCRRVSIPSKIASLNEPNIRDLHFTGDTLWIATQHQGLIKYLPGTGVLHQYYHPELGKLKHINSIQTIASSGNQYLWLGTTQNFLFRFNRNTGEFRHFQYYEPELNLAFRTITDLQMQGNDSLWIASTDGGLFLFNTQTLDTELFSCQDFEQGVNYNSLRCLYIDNQGILWVGINGMGINFIKLEKKRFTLFAHDAGVDYLLDYPSVRSILQIDNKLYIGGYNGLNVFDLKNGRKEYLFRGCAVYSLQPDLQRNRILLGSEGGSLYTYKLDSGKEKRYILRIKSKGKPDESYNQIYEITPFKEDLYFLGGLNSLAVFNAASNRIEKIYRNNPAQNNSLQPGSVKVILPAKDDKFWIATEGGGISLFNPNTGQFQVYNVENTNYQLLSNLIFSVQKDENGILWLGTDRGLCRFDPENNSFFSYSTEDGLPNNTINGIIIDEKGNLWLSTNQGFCSFNVQSGQVEQFSSRDGLLNNEFNKSAYYKNADGRIFFGGVAGVVAFYPSEISSVFTLQPPVIIRATDFNQPIVTDTIMPYKHNIQVSSERDFLSFEVASLNYLYPGENFYQYRIKEISPQWINNGRNNSISLIDLKPGDYHLEVRTSLNGFDWIELRHDLNLYIKPQLIETTWFKAMLIIIGLVLFLGFFYVRIYFLKQQEKRLQLLVDESTSQLKTTNNSLRDEVSMRKNTEKQLREANHTKDKFFSIIAHDLRSPFMSLQGFSDLLMQGWNEFDDGEKQEMVRKINNNARNTFSLLNSLLEWARLQQGTIIASIKEIPPCDIVNEVLREISAQAEIKNITVNQHCAPDLLVRADENMLATVLRNIISNSVKYTPEGGQIEFFAQKSGHMIEFVIQDNGIGMNEDTRVNLFKIESNVSREGTKGEKGSGFGLIISAELIRLMNGSIKVESSPGEGSRFIIDLPASF